VTALVVDGVTGLECKGSVVANRSAGPLAGAQAGRPAKLPHFCRSFCLAGSLMRPPCWSNTVAQKPISMCLKATGTEINRRTGAHDIAGEVSERDDARSVCRAHPRPSHEPGGGKRMEAPSE
jgi:hypothetical protein